MVTRVKGIPQKGFFAPGGPEGEFMAAVQHALRRRRCIRPRIPRPHKEGFQRAGIFGDTSSAFVGALPAQDMEVRQDIR